MELLFSDTKVNVENTKQLEKDLTEERARYQKLLSDYLQLEERHGDLKGEMNDSTVRNTPASPLAFRKQ